MKVQNPSNVTFAAVVLASLTLFAVACGRDPIFFTISNETAPRLPRIRGAPTAMATLDVDGRPVMFVASRQGLFWYAPSGKDADGNWNGSNPVWQTDLGIPQPGAGRPIDLAVTGDRLYVLVMSEDGDGIGTTVTRLEKAGGNWKWTAVPGAGGNVQAVFADPSDSAGRLFAGTVDGIFYVDRAGASLSRLDVPARTVEGSDDPFTGTGLLSGVAYRGGNHFLSTGTGVLRVAGTDAKWLRQGAGIADDAPHVPQAFIGMTKLPDGSIIAVERQQGFLNRVEDGYFSRIPATDADGNAVADEWMRTVRDATGALAIWRDGDGDGASNVLLVAGVQGSRSATTFNNGYVEFRLKPSDGSLDSSQARLETNTLLSVSGENAQYRTSLGRLPVNHLFQAPSSIDSERTFFASTQVDGLWSFRLLDGRRQWNAEP